MTLQKLSEYYKLRQRLSKDRELLASLRARATPGAQSIDGMPLASAVRDKVGDLAAEIADLERQIAVNKKRASRAKATNKAYIGTIADSRTRMIFQLRFLRCLTWEEVAAIIGGRNTAAGVKKTCYRYLDAESRGTKNGDLSNPLINKSTGK